jgi:hypothetical protein
VHPIHTDYACPGDGHADDTRVDLRGSDASDRDTHDHRNDGKRGLACAATPFSRFLAVSQLGLLPQLRCMCSGKLLDSFGQAGSYVFVVFRTKLHPRCQCGLAVSTQLLAGFARNCPVVRLYRIGRCWIQRVGLRIRWRRTWLRVVLGRVVLSGIVLKGVILRWLILWRLILWRLILWWWLVLGRIRLGGRPLSGWLGHEHRIVRPYLGSWTLGRRLGLSNADFQGAYRVAECLLGVDPGRLSAGR